MRLLKRLSVILGIIVILIIAAGVTSNKIINDRIAAATLSGSNDGQQQGRLAGTEKGISEGETKGSAAGAVAGKINGINEGSTSGKQAGETAGNAAGTSAGSKDGTSAGSVKGNSDGYIAGKNDGYEQGYKTGFEQGTGAGYIVRRPTYQEAVQIVQNTSSDDAEDLVNESEGKGIQAGLVALTTANLPAYEHYELIAFNTIDKGIVYFSPTTHGELALKTGSSFSKLNGLLSPGFDDTITKITIIW